MLKVNREKNNNVTMAALFIYIPIIVDFYRKFSSNIIRLPVATETVRNVIYIAAFIVIIWGIHDKQQYAKLAFIAAAFSAIALFSYLINPYDNTENLYISIILMFFSRLLPAYYFGRYALCGEEKLFVRKVASLSWIALIYSFLVLIYPETSSASYITISNNLIIPCVICFISSDGVRISLIPKLIASIGMIVIVIYGGRGTFVSLLLLVILSIFITNKKKRSILNWILIILMIILGIFIIIYYKEIALHLLKFDPSSRTLRLISRGELFWSSGRDGYYDAAFQSFINKPLHIYGFLGDRFYFAEYFGGYHDYSTIYSMFSHNMILELMLCLGILPGLSVAIWAIIKIIKAYLSAIKGEIVQCKLYTIILTTTIIPAMVSSSMLNDYTIWLLTGLAIAYVRDNHRKKSDENQTESENLHVNT